STIREPSTRTVDETDLDGVRSLVEGVAAVELDVEDVLVQRVDLRHGVCEADTPLRSRQRAQLVIPNTEAELRGVRQLETPEGPAIRLRHTGRIAVQIHR